MIARATALLLSLCIALPMCWCCVGVAACEQVKSCCAVEAPCSNGQHEHSPATPQDKHCPCTAHEAARDVASTVVKAPAPRLDPIAGPTWQAAVAETIFSSTWGKPHARHDYGLMRSMVPVYVQHCALLI